jgi:hypothetical protein
MARQFPSVGTHDAFVHRFVSYATTETGGPCSFSPEPSVGLAPPTLVGNRGRHCPGVNYTTISADAVGKAEVGHCEDNAGLLRAFGGSLIAGADVDVSGRQFRSKAGECSGHVGQGHVQYAFFVVGNPFRLERFLGGADIVNDELHITHGTRTAGVESENVYLNAAQNFCEVGQRSGAIVARKGQLGGFRHKAPGGKCDDMLPEAASSG